MMARIRRLTRYLGRPDQMPLVIVESPYAGDHTRNVAYLRQCLRDCILRGESPYASHGLLTQPGVLDDEHPPERQLGIRAGHAWYAVAERCVVYQDYGLTEGMRAGIRAAKAADVTVELRALGGPL